MKLGMIVASKGQFAVYDTLDNEGEPNGYAVVGPGITPVGMANLGAAIALAEKLDAFATKPPVEVLRRYPDLAGAFAAVAAIEKRVSTDDLTPAQRAAVMAGVRQNVINRVGRGDSITMTIREHKNVIQESEKLAIKKDTGLER